MGFRRNSLQRIRQAREIMPEGTTIIADGGIGLTETKLVYEAGADTVVLGRLLFPEERSEENGIKRVLAPKDRVRKPAELLEEILKEVNAGGDGR